MATIDKAFIKIRSGKLEIDPGRMIDENMEITLKVVGSLWKTETRPNGDGTVDLTWVIEPTLITEEN